VLARLDADSDLDIAVTNIDDDTVSVLMNNGDGTFSPQVVYTVNNGPYGITALNVDNDADNDLAVANYGYGDPCSVSILINNGDGTFSPHIPYPVDLGPVGIDDADRNNDGWRDIAVVSQDVGYVSVLMNNGDGTFAPYAEYAVFGAPYGIKIADLNRDGFDDITAAGETGLVSILMNQTDGTFGPTSNTDPNISMLGIDAGDVDGNGTLELAVACYGGSEVRVLFGEWPAITLQPQSQNVNVGSAAVFTVTAIGTGPLTYQWRRNGVNLVDGLNISGANSDTLTIDPVAVRDAVNYDVIVTNDCGPMFSDSVMLSVNVPCLADIAPLPAGNDVVNVEDLLAVIGAWGPCGNPSNCPADIAPPGGDDLVKVSDLLAVIGAWGPCP